MKILLSAYACDPSRGSESAVGWHWAIELERLGHEVWVLTHGKHHRQNIEAFARETGLPPKIHVVYIDIGSWPCNKDGLPYLENAHYICWQWKAYELARRLHASVGFELVHHITWAGIRFASFMGRLGLPFLFGPVGGGDAAPLRLRVGYGLPGWILDLARDCSNAFVCIDPTLHAVWKQADRIYVRSPATARLIPGGWQHKVCCYLGLGIDQPMKRAELDNDRDGQHLDGLRVLYAGNFLYLKGMHLGLPAFAALIKKYPQATLTMVGRGREETLWRRLADRLGIAQHVTWIPWVPRERLAALYRDHDVLLFPSLRDSGGFVVLEALAHGLPVICVDLGGPPQMVDETCGRVIPVSNSNRATVIKGLADALIAMAASPDLRSRLSTGAVDRAGQFRWSDTVSRVYVEIEASLKRR